MRFLFVLRGLDRRQPLLQSLVSRIETLFELLLERVRRERRQRRPATARTRARGRACMRGSCGVIEVDGSSRIRRSISERAAAGRR